ncbi:Gfo/Idh/MocA family protein [Pelagibacterium luteolum]|uniref:Predicted dehydrogenase n=1 Tax=Pelagibacterium luteolum TaxID=440168 RepID=A0A1G7SVH4_9HYPH|nr:Gfo/Idh/MocA family oxidoreductase [Pelagibacterium luteolum]SDG26958.1 Predicted dehydrogenase [Pelagibacterium luteolum]
MGNADVVIGVVGIDHRHIYGMLSGMLDAGARCKKWWTEGEPQTLQGFEKRFDTVPRAADRRELFEDPEINLILIAAPPHQRADLAIEAMEHGKDVMLDKPGCISFAELERIKAVVERTGQIWSVDFSERFEVPASIKALELVRGGEIGEVVQTLAVGPHRLNRATRPDWFFDSALYGGILGDIGTHQIDQFLTFTGSQDAEIVAASVGNFANPNDENFQDFGEILLRSDIARGYARLDWYTPDALPNWGDGRLMILGTEGYIELRKYVDIEGRPGTDHLFIVNNKRSDYIDCSGIPLTYFKDLATDVRERTETALTFSHAYTVTRLALEAQQFAERNASGK